MLDYTVNNEPEAPAESEAVSEPEAQPTPIDGASGETETEPQSENPSVDAPENEPVADIFPNKSIKLKKQVAMPVFLFLYKSQFLAHMYFCTQCLKIG